MNGKIMKNLCAAAIGGLALFGGQSLAAASLTPPKPTASKGTYTAYVKVTWSRVSGASTYVIKRGTTSSYAGAAMLTRVSGSVTTLYDSSAVAGKTYYYWVCPCNARGTYWYNTGRYDWGYRKNVTTESLALSATSVTAGTKVFIYYKRGSQYVMPSSLRYTASPSGCATVTKYARANISCGYVTTRSAGTVTVYAGSRSVTLRITGSKPDPTPGGTYISGPTSLKYGQSGNYYLYVNGKKITASSVAWSRSGLATMQDKGSYGLLKATSRPVSTNKVYVYATYGGKPYSKTVTITK